MLDWIQEEEPVLPSIHLPYSNHLGFHVNPKDNPVILLIRNHQVVKEASRALLREAHIAHHFDAIAQHASVPEDTAKSCRWMVIFVSRSTQKEYLDREMWSQVLPRLQRVKIVLESH